MEKTPLMGLYSYFFTRAPRLGLHTVAVVVAKAAVAVVVLVVMVVVTVVVRIKVLMFWW